jgi:hypothetical protein
VSCYTVFLNKGVGSLVIGQMFKKLFGNMLHICVTVASRTGKWDVVILVAHKIHHTWTLTSCNGMPWISMGFSVHLIFRDFTHPIVWKTVSPISQCWINFFSIYPIKFPYKTLSWSITCFKESFLTTVVLYTSKYCSYIAFCASDAFAAQTRPQAFLHISPT